MPRKRHPYLGNPESQHLHIDDESEKPIGAKEPCQQQHEPTSESLSYQVEGGDTPLGKDGLVLTESRDVGSEEEEDLPAGAIGKLGDPMVRELLIKHMRKMSLFDGLVGDNKVVALVVRLYHITL
ncbi:unnamed protein product [Calypogeia fissa]